MCECMFVCVQNGKSATKTYNMNDFLSSNIPSKNPNCVDRDGFVATCRQAVVRTCVVYEPLIIIQFIYLFVCLFAMCLALLRRPCGFDLVFLEQTVSLIADEDPDTQYLM